MKIDFYISSLSGGGAEKVLITIATQLAAAGHDTAIISLEKRPQFYQVSQNVELIRCCNRGKRAFIQDYLQVGKHLKDRQADISVSFLSRCNWLLLLCSLWKNYKIIVCDRNNPVREHSRLAFLVSNLLYLRADRIVVQTSQIKSCYWKRIRKKISVIENCIDTKSLEKQVPYEVQREKVILSMGRLEKQKDFKTLIRAFSRICSDYPEWKVKIFGDGNMKEKLQKEIRTLGLEKRIILCGRTEKPFEEMCRASIFVLSSFYEGFPNVLCEALYAGDLCISSNCISGPAELIDHGKNGWLFPVGDQMALAEILKKVISMETRSDAFRKRARKSVERLHLEKNIADWEHLLMETAMSRRR